MTAAAPTSRPRSPRRSLLLTESLNRILREARGKRGSKGRPITLGLIVDSTAERAFGVLLAFLCLPFLTPIPLPLVSIPFGIALFLLGLQVAVQKTKPWLPAFMLNMRLPLRLTSGLLKFTARIFRPLERFIHPRLGFMENSAGKVVAGVALALDGIFLALPWPPGIPCTNAIPAWMALIKILGLTERDGAALLGGSILSYGALAAFVIAVFLIAH